jgi:hypothetical protein
MSPDPDTERGEPRAPVLIVLVGAVALPLLMPDQLLPGPQWLLPAVIGCFIIAMVITDPGRIDRRSERAHRIRIGLVVVLVGTAAWTTTILTDDLIFNRGKIAKSATSLLQAGGLVWLSLVVSFAFLYWELDLGGPGARAQRPRAYPDLAFPQELSPEICPPGWRPVFVDYLYVGFTNGLAFSPTDAMPLAHWTKLAMGIQSIASLLIIGLVVARAVNFLG